MLEHLPLIVFLVTFVLIFVLRMPIPAGMIAACTLYFLTDGLIKGVGFGALITGAGGSLHLVAQKTIEAIFTNGTIVAVPLFIFAANVMNAGKITEYVFGTCMGLVGRFRGGLAHVNVLASLVFSGMTGSAIADASGLGKLEIDAMRKEGYDDGFSCAITAASATIGPIFPAVHPHGRLRDAHRRLRRRAVHGGHGARCAARRRAVRLCVLHRQKEKLPPHRAPRSCVTISCI